MSLSYAQQVATSIFALCGWALFMRFAAETIRLRGLLKAERRYSEHWFREKERLELKLRLILHPPEGRNLKVVK
jgi:hypothetical protein